MNLVFESAHQITFESLKFMHKNGEIHKPDNNFAVINVSYLNPNYWHNTILISNAAPENDTPAKETRSEKGCLIVAITVG